MDRTSELPTKILYQILSRLPTKTAAQTSVLSKPWLQACSTNPYLSFDEFDFNPHLNYNKFYLERPPGKSIEFHGKFLRIVDDILGRYLREKLPISTFKLCISFSNETDCDGLVDKWLDIIAKKNVSQFALLVKSRSGKFSLSADTIFSMELLQQLELNWCKILLKQKAVLFDDRIKCRNIKNLTLCHVSVSESTLHSLISCCPQIMMISLQYCVGFSRIRMSNLPKLLSLSILCCYVEEVHIIEAPKLLSFKYGERINLSSLNIGTCQNLTRVEFVSAKIINDDILFQLIKKLPFIKELSLRYCEQLRKIKISSSTLEVCSIGYCYLLVQAIFDVPKLLSLAISIQYKLPSLSFECCSSKCRISINYCCILEAEGFIRLRKFLVELNDQAVDLTLSNQRFRNNCTSGLRYLPTPEVENLILPDRNHPNLSYSSYFDAIFWTCWPKSLTVECDPRFRKFIRQQLLKKYQWRLNKCTWKEYLINAQIEYKKTIGGDWVPLDRKMLAANPRIIEAIHTIRFKQTERKDKNKESFISRYTPR
uniref:F-box/LRR-repeat protein At3g03360-like n=1 Tax=Nicotiana tabacum TaxID=4097 RepID=A0A1S4BS30_TOBAC|nr:PREDICTED: F-box/LRR-repeat protein At3g03360-like [Nicotiana tabacum]